MNPGTSNRTEKKVLLRVPPSRVWQAFINPADFASWFGVKLARPFRVGQWLRGRVMQPGYEHLTMELFVEQMIANEIVAFRWRPYALDPLLDYSAEPMTFVQLLLEPVVAGTVVSAVELGFRDLPLSRRLQVYRRSADGWGAQLDSLERLLGPSSVLPQS